jgi:dienelactone hydrolase
MALHPGRTSHHPLLPATRSPGTPPPCRLGIAVGCVVWLLVAPSAAGCNPLFAKARPDPPARAYPGTDTIQASLQNGWITVTISLPQRPAGPKPAVITPIVDERLLLDRGIAVVRFRTHWEQLRGLAPGGGAGQEPAEAPHPPDSVARVAEAPGPVDPADGPAAGGTGGTTVGAWLLASPRPETVGRAYFEIIAVDANDSIPKVVDYLRSMPQIDPDRISISGSSTSGFVALQAMAGDPELASGVVRVACGDYFAFLRDSSLALHGDPRWLPDGKMTLEPKYEAKLRASQPIHRADRFPPRPLLLMAGENDPAIPIECARRTAAAFERAYAAAGASDRFRFVVFPGEGHNLGAESQRLALEWWERWLVNGTRQAPSASGPSVSRGAMSAIAAGR